MDRAGRRYTLAVAAICALAAWLRFSFPAWDGLNQLHPDERGMLFAAQALSLESPNPYQHQPHYAYGHLPLYLMALAGSGGDPLTHFDRLTLAGRALSALFDTGTVLIVMLMARDYFGRGASLLAGGLVAFAVLHIQQAHFGTVDSALAFFSTAALWSLKHDQHGWVSGALVGLAAGSKATGALLLIPVVVHHVQRADRAAVLLRATTGAAIAFALTNPFALIDAPTTLRNLSTQGAMVSGRLAVPFTRQYVGTAPILYPLVQQARWTLGLPLTAAGLAGVVFEKRAPTLRLWTALMVVVTGLPLVKFPRYTLIYTPVVIALAAGWLSTRPRWFRAVVLIPTGVFALAFWAIYFQPHPWVAASRWMYDTLPPGTVIAVEAGDDVLPLNLDGQLREATFETAVIDPTDPDIELLARADVLVIASKRGWGTLPRFSTEATAYYESILNGSMEFNVEASFSRGGVLLADGDGWLGADESLVLYDRPRVLILR